MCRLIVGSTVLGSTRRCKILSVQKVNRNFRTFFELPSVRPSFARPSVRQARKKGRRKNFCVAADDTNGALQYSADMGKCTRTNKTRPKREGIETVKERRARQTKAARDSSVEDIRVVRRRGPKPERAPAGELPKKRTAPDARLKALLKLNKQIAALREKQVRPLLSFA